MILKSQNYSINFSAAAFRSILMYPEGEASGEPEILPQILLENPLIAAPSSAQEATYQMLAYFRVILAEIWLIFRELAAYRGQHCRENAS